MKKVLFTGLVASAALLTGTAVQAQVSFGPRVGLNAATFGYDLKGRDKPNSKLLWGPQVGVSLNAQFGKLSVQPSLLFTMKGNKVEESANQTSSSGGTTVTSAYEAKHTIRLNYLEIPVNLVYSTNGAESGFQVFAGPYVGVGLSGELKSETKLTTTTNGQTTTESSSDKGDVEFASKEGEDRDKLYRRRLDAGINLGLGYKVGGIQAQLGYDLGLVNLVPNQKNGEDPGIKVRNRGFQLALSYFFE